MSLRKEPAMPMSNPDFSLMTRLYSGLQNQKVAVCLLLSH